MKLLLKNILSPVLCVAVVVSCFVPTQADEKPSVPELKTHTVAAEPFKVEIELKGRAIAENMTTVAVNLQSWSSLVIDEVVAHGVSVREGDVLVKFRTDKLDEAIADLETKLAIAELAIAQAEHELPLAEKTIALDAAAAERNHRIADEDTRHYLEVGKSIALKSAKFSLKGTQQRHDSVLEELRQLEKMYASDDLTEEPKR